MYITILCKVVDNFGDIGVAWRLCRRLSKIQSKYKICLVVDDLEAFAKIEDKLPHQTSKQSITINGIEIFPWNDNELCHEVFSRNDGERLSLILELFQCGRPEWMEKILFEEKLERTVHIIMIDYLTAEKYAEDFHCLQSLTRSAKVQKVNFMPGFTEKTGGLVIDEEWQEVPLYKADGPVLIFTYEKDWSELVSGWLSSTKCVRSLSNVEESKPQYNPKLLLAQGRGKESFIAAAEACGAAEFIEELPYLNQTDWDQVMKGCSALVIRGEESMSRACLSGIPFIWHAYPQSDEYQLVKVRALLERMKPHFAEEDFEIVEKAWLEINSSDDVSGVTLNKMSFPDLIGESFKDSAVQIPDRVCFANVAESSPSMTENPYSAFFTSIPRLLPGFRDFASSLRKNGDLACNLMTYIEKLAII